MGASVDIWFPIYIGDFFSDTASMTGHEVGAYVLIISHLWRAGGSVKADDKQLAKLVKATSRQLRDIKETLWPLFEIKAGMLSHPQTTLELGKARQNREKKRRAGFASGVSRRAASAEHVFNAREAGAEPRAGSGEGKGTGSLSKEEAREHTYRAAAPLVLVEGGSK